MILIFDLDDTLYDERSFVISGLSAVARMGEVEFGWNAHESLATMIATLDRNGRGAIFDAWLAAHSCKSRRLIQRCVHVYRSHPPEIVLAPSTRMLLQRLTARHRLYLVTDGHKLVQKSKVRALGIEPLFQRVFITHQYGVRRAKPSTYCFERIRDLERCEWSDMAYIGDNPAKDFVNLNRLGVQTIRVLTGPYKNVHALPGYDACFKIKSLAAMQSIISRVVS